VRSHSCRTRACSESDPERKKSQKGTLSEPHPHREHATIAFAANPQHAAHLLRLGLQGCHCTALHCTALRLAAGPIVPEGSQPMALSGMC
jgi:hypothetical protein